MTRLSVRPTWLSFALVVSLLFNAAFVASGIYSRMAEETEPPGEGQPALSEDPPSLLDQLDLSRPQRQAIEAKHRSLKQATEQLRHEVRSAREQVWRVIASDAATPDQISRQINFISERQKRIQELVAEYLLGLRSQISETQIRRFDTFVKDRMCYCPMCDAESVPLS